LSVLGWNTLHNLCPDFCSDLQDESRLVAESQSKLTDFTENCVVCDDSDFLASQSDYDSIQFEDIKNV